MAATGVIWPAGKALAAETADPVLSLMLEKGMITENEAAKVQAQVDARRTNPAAVFPESKWKISSGIKSMEIFGDLRLRYEGRSAEDPKGGNITLNRLRYAVRLGLRGDLFDDFYYGLRVETSANPRSSFVTMGSTSSSSATPYQGPFGKSSAGIGIGQVYLGWHPEPWAEVTLGKMPNPLYTTSMVWSPSISPEGAAEHFKYTVGEADLFANFGQFLYQDINPAQTSPNYFGNLGNYKGANPPFLLAWQAGADYHFSKKWDLKVAPVLYYTIGTTANGTPPNGLPAIPDFSGTYVGQGAYNYVNLYYPSGNGFDGFVANQTGINDLMVLEIPFELNFKLKQFDARLFGDYAQNLKGAARARAAYAAQSSPLLIGSGLAPISSPQTHDTKAYQFGLAIGSPDSLGLVNGTTAKRHSWEVRSYWQHVEQYALDPNLLDQDFFEGRENLQGFYTAAAFGFTDNLIGTVRYGRASRINGKLGTGGSGQDIPQMNPVNNFDLFQVDLTFKF